MMQSSTVEAVLGQGITALPCAVTNEQVAQFLTYLQLLNRWNRIHNLTAVRNPREQVIVHLLDCLAILPQIPVQGYLADIGSGAGLPAIVIAVMRPQMKVFAVESSHKKAAFIRQAATTLKLDNVTVISTRVEAWQPPQAFDVIISRAMAAPEMLLDLTAHLSGDHTQWLMMCGHAPTLPEMAGFNLTEQIDVNVPLLDAVRTLLIIGKH